MNFNGLEKKLIKKMFIQKQKENLLMIFILFNQKSDLRLLRACLPGQGDHHVVIFLKTLF
jgi:hypothetical protein